MQRSENSFERELQSIGQTYDRMWRRDPEAIWGQLTAPSQRFHREGAGGGWWVAASALILLLACGGGIVHGLTRAPAAPAGVKLTIIPPKTRTEVAYKISSQYRDVTAKSTSGVPAKTETGRMQEKLQVLMVPTSDSGYKLALRYEPLTAVVDGTSLARGYPPGESFNQNAVVTYVVGSLGKVLSARATPPLALGMQYTGKTMRDPLLPPVPDKDLKPGTTWKIDAAVAAGTLPGLPGRYTYEGVVDGYFKVHFTASWTATTTPWGQFVGEPSRYTSVGDIYLDPASHLLERMTERTTGNGTEAVAAGAAPDRSVFQWTWQRSR